MGYPVHLNKNVKFRQPEPHFDGPCVMMDVRRVLRAAPRMEISKNDEWMVKDRDWTHFVGNTRRHLRSESPLLQPFASGGTHSESSAAYAVWKPSGRNNSTAEERAAYFNGLQKEVNLKNVDRKPAGLQAATLLDLMTIRAFHGKALRRYSLGTALGFRTRQGALTKIPAIIVFVASKVHTQWLLDIQKLPAALEGPGGVWCDVDVVEFSYYGAPSMTPKEQVYTDLVEGLRGNYPCIGSGSQVASQETYGTLGAIVQSQTGSRQLGFLTNRHVAVDLDYPNQKMFHPLPPSLGPGVYLGDVERATSFITDDLWYGIFAGRNPETFVRADGAFIPFSELFDPRQITASVKGLGEIGDVMRVDLQASIDCVVSQHVTKVGRSSGLTKGVIMGYAVEYNDGKGICFFTDFLIVGENKQAFDLEGDSGSLILLTGEIVEKPRPIGIIWGGTANRGRLKLRNGHGPENWTSGVDLGRLLDLLQLDLITTQAALEDAIKLQSRYQDATATDDGSPKGNMRGAYESDDGKALEMDERTTDQYRSVFDCMAETSAQQNRVCLGKRESQLLGRIGSSQAENYSYSENVLPYGSRIEMDSTTDEVKQAEGHGLERIESDEISLGIGLGGRDLKRRRSG